MGVPDGYPCLANRQSDISRIRSPLLIGRSARLARMFAIPSFNLVTAPHSADCQLCLRSRKVAVRLDQLAHPLAGDAQNLGDLGDTHEIVRHHIQV